MKKNRKEDKLFSVLAAGWVVFATVIIIRLLIGYNHTSIEVEDSKDINLNQEQVQVQAQNGEEHNNEKERIEEERRKEEHNEEEIEQKIEELETKYSDDASVDKTYLPNLVDLCKTDHNALPILERYDEYQSRLIKMVTTYNETMQYVIDYPDKKDVHVENIDVSNEIKPGEVPLFLQWDERWGYEEYSGGLVGYTACGPTCVSMLETYFKGECEHNPKDMAQFSTENGYAQDGNGTKWTLMSLGVNKLGLTSEKLTPSSNQEVTKERVNEAISSGKKIICSVKKGYFTSGGHFIIISDYKDGKLSVKDPNSRKNSEIEWDFSDVYSQIRMMWIIGKE